MSSQTTTIDGLRLGTSGNEVLTLYHTNYFAVATISMFVHYLCTLRVHVLHSTVVLHMYIYPLYILLHIHVSSLYCLFVPTYNYVFPCRGLHNLQNTTTCISMFLNVLPTSLFYYCPLYHVTIYYYILSRVA